MTTLAFIVLALGAFAVALLILGWAAIWMWYWATEAWYTLRALRPHRSVLR